MIDNEKVEEVFLVLEDKLEKTVNVLKEEYAGIRAGRANHHRPRAALGLEPVGLDIEIAERLII